MRRWIPFVQALMLVALIYVYLYPGSEAMFAGRHDVVMSDNTDGATAPFTYDVLARTFWQHPSYFFYGAVFVEGINPEQGTPYWVPWNERWIALTLTPFFALEQLSTALVFILIFLNALAMYALSRYLNWNRSISSGLAIAWALCPYIRARAKVHMAFTGVYHLPLIFLALFLVVRGRGWKSLLGASAAFLMAMTVAHYYIVTTLFLWPLFLIFIMIQPETRLQTRTVVSRMGLAILPAILFLGWNFACPIPSGVHMEASKALPKGGEVPSGEVHPFLSVYAARPIDYLGGDISLANQATDSNPVREWVNDKILSDLGNGNTHERSNGIRWSLLILALIALIYLVLGKFREHPATRSNLWFFAFFGLICFWLSLSADTPFPGWGLSYWLHEVISQVRVPSRAGIGVHFAVLMLCGFFLASGVRWRKFLLFPGVFPILMVLAYPPMVQNMPMAAVRPAYSALQREHGPCGVGMYFPFVNFYEQGQLYYLFIQRMRGSDCALLNAMSTQPRLSYMTQAFPPRQDYLNHLPVETTSADRLEKIARCVPLSWIAFDPATPVTWRTQMCQRLGWTLHEDLSCIAPNKAAPLQRLPDECG